jgi:hypothetical protein
VDRGNLKPETISMFLVLRGKNLKTKAKENNFIAERKQVKNQKCRVFPFENVLFIDFLQILL